MPSFNDFIIYADESGDHGLASIDPGYPVFVLACCVFRKNAYINRLVPGLHGFKFRHFGHDGVILHERDIRKDMGAFAMLKTPDRKEEFLEELTEIIRNAPMEVVAAVVRKDELRQRPNPPHPYHLAFRFCLERIHELVAHRGETGGVVHVTCEARGKMEDALLELEFRRIRDGDNATGAPLPFDIVIADKKVNCAGLQVADLMARPIGMSVLRPDQPNRAFEVIREKIALDPKADFDTPAGKIDIEWGLKCFP